MRVAYSRRRDDENYPPGRLVVPHADEKRIGFADGETAEVEAVIWATGYRDETRWVAIPEVKDTGGAFAHQRGVSPVPGLYLMGRSWQWTRGPARGCRRCFRLRG